MLREAFGCDYVPDNRDWDESPSHGLIAACQAKIDGSSLKTDEEILMQYGLDR
jgi:hypothetical protein